MRKILHTQFSVKLRRLLQVLTYEIALCTLFVPMCLVW